MNPFSSIHSVLIAICFIHGLQPSHLMPAFVFAIIAFPSENSYNNLDTFFFNSYDNTSILFLKIYNNFYYHLIHSLFLEMHLQVMPERFYHTMR